MDTVREKATVFFTEHKLPLLVGFFGMMFFVYGLIALVGQQQPQEEIFFTPGGESTMQKTAVKSVQDTARMLIVDVEGGVLTPGVYRLPESAIVQDAIEAAGGFSQEADKERSAKSINLAARVIAGGKIYVPKIGDEAQNTGSIEGTESIGGDSQQIDINSASQGELDTLPGVGAVTAEKIVANRPYASIEELLSKKVVNKGVFEKIKEKIVAY